MKVGDSGQDMQRGRDGSYVTIRGNGGTKSGEEKCVCGGGGGDQELMYYSKRPRRAFGDRPCM